MVHEIILLSSAWSYVSPGLFAFEPLLLRKRPLPILFLWLCYSHLPGCKRPGSTCILTSNRSDCWPLNKGTLRHLGRPITWTLGHADRSKVLNFRNATLLLAQAFSLCPRVKYISALNQTRCPVIFTHDRYRCLNIGRTCSSHFLHSCWRLPRIVGDFCPRGPDWDYNWTAQLWEDQTPDCLEDLHKAWLTAKSMGSLLMEQSHPVIVSKSTTPEGQWKHSTLFTFQFWVFGWLIYWTCLSLKLSNHDSSLVIWQVWASLFPDLEAFVTKKQTYHSNLYTLYFLAW